MSNVDGDCSHMRDSEYFTKFRQRVKSGIIGDKDLKEYAVRFGKNKNSSRENLAMVIQDYKNQRICASEYIFVNFMAKAAMGIVTAADIKAARKAWGGNLTGEDVQAVLAANSSSQKELLDVQESDSVFSLEDREYLMKFQKKIKNHSISDCELQAYASRFGKNTAALAANFALVSSEYKKGRISASEYAALNFITKAALGAISSADIKAARRAWSGELTGEDIKAIQDNNRSVPKFLSAVSDKGSCNIEEQKFFAEFLQKVKKRIITESDMKEYAGIFGKAQTGIKRSLVLVEAAYKNGNVCATEYAALNLITKGALGIISAVDITAARRAWGGQLTGEDVEAVLMANRKMEQNLSKETEGSKSEVNDNDFFRLFRQKVRGGALSDTDLTEYASRFDERATQKNLALISLEYKTRSLSALDYIVLNLVMKAACKTLLAADIKAARKVLGGGLTDEDVQAILTANDEPKENEPNEDEGEDNIQSRKDIAAVNKDAQSIIQEKASEKASALSEEDFASKNSVSSVDKPNSSLEEPVATQVHNVSTEEIDAEEVMAPDAPEDSTEIAAQTTPLSDKEYFEYFQRKVIDDCVEAADFKEYACRFGKDPEAAKSNLKLFTMQYRNNMISGVKFAELNFIAKAALGIATEVDMKAARGAWVGDLTFSDVSAVLEQ